LPHHTNAIAIGSHTRASRLPLLPTLISVSAKFAIGWLRVIVSHGFNLGSLRERRKQVRALALSLKLETLEYLAR
jgi:hypothetical protein